MKILAKRLNTVGVGLGEFCRTHLNTDYRTFQYRMKTGHYYPAEVVYICMFLNDASENIFGKPFTELVVFSGPEHIKQLAIDSVRKDPDKFHRLIGITTPTKEKGTIIENDFQFIEIDLFNHLDTPKLLRS